ncbi:MAG: hypothetical protein ACR2JL_04255 [Candidatus Limnocylindrus sp.]|jgi:hypothetical protein
MNNQPAPKGNRKNAIRLLVGGGVAAFILGNVLAAAININNGTTVNFGQGAAGMTACASGISYSINSDFNTSGFQMQSIEVTVTDQPRLDASGSPVTDTVGTIGACDGKNMTIYAYSVGTDSGSTAIGTMWLSLGTSGVLTETYVIYAAGAGDTQTGVADASPRYDSLAVTPATLSGLAFEVTDR